MDFLLLLLFLLPALYIHWFTNNIDNIYNISFLFSHILLQFALIFTLILSLSSIIYPLSLCSNCLLRYFVCFVFHAILYNLLSCPLLAFQFFFFFTFPHSLLQAVYFVFFFYSPTCSTNLPGTVFFNADVDKKK